MRVLATVAIAVALGVVPLRAGAQEVPVKAAPGASLPWLADATRNAETHLVARYGGGSGRALRGE